MNKTLPIALLALCTAMPTVLSAQFTSIKQRFVIPVRAIDANTFEAIEADGAGGTQIWCAAAKYTRDHLGQRGGDITVLEARGPSAAFPGRKSVVFTTAPVADAVESSSQGVRTKGKSFSMAHAYALCRSNPDQFIRFRVVAP